MASPDYLTVELHFKDIARIFAKITVDSKTECWIWNGACGGRGYGHAVYKRKSEYTHRLLYSWIVGPLPRGRTATKHAQLDHLCRNIRCCNPLHLELVTQKVNSLRGNGWSAINAAKTRCPRGHEYDFYTSKYRWCRKCDAEASKQYYHGSKHDRLLQEAKTYYHQNRERISQQRKDCRLNRGHQQIGGIAQSE